MLDLSANNPTPDGDWWRTRTVALGAAATRSASTTNSVSE